MNSPSLLSFGAVQPSVDEVSEALLCKVFRETTPVLGDFVRKSLVMAYGEDRWLHEASRGLGRKSCCKLKTPEALYRDVFLVTEVLLNKLDEVFTDLALDVQGLESYSVLLQKLAIEIDCVGQTRTSLFHGHRLSTQEVHRCLLNLEQLWRRFRLETSEDYAARGDVHRHQLKVSQSPYPHALACTV